MAIEPTENFSVLDDVWCLLTFIKDLQKLENKNQDILVLLVNELIDQDWQDHESDNLVYTISEFS